MPRRLLLSAFLLILAPAGAMAAGPQMRAGEWEFSPPTTRYCFASDTPAIAAPQSLSGCSPLQIAETPAGFTYATTCTMLGTSIAVQGLLSLVGPDAYTNTIRIRMADGSETTTTTSLRRIGNCQADDSPPPD
jgi:hypothetical protein